MSKFLADLIKRLTSRKFLLTVAAALIFIANKQYDQLMVVVAGYLGVEGLGDAAERYTTPKALAAQASLKETALTFGALDSPDAGVDRNTFVPGSISGQ